MKISATFFCSLITLSLAAQDQHFSFSEFSSTFLNPGLAGANSPMQGLVSFRNQWSSFAEPFQTVAATFDARFNEKKRQKAGIIAGGINLYNDRSGDLRVSTSAASINLAYHLLIDNNNTIGLGIYGGFGQRVLNPAGGKWGTQYNGSTFDGNIDPGESFNNATFSYVDAGAGVVYTYGSNNGYMTQNNNKKLNIGLSVFHINQPKYSFVNSANEQLYMRMSAFVNGEFGIANTPGSILPGIYFHRQKNAQELLFGANYKYSLNGGSRSTGFTRPSSLYTGLFFRLKDALVAKVMFEYDQFMLGFGYDINISDLSVVSKARGGFEVFLRFNANNGGGFRSRI
jgi:type IX secretion system PorP/SprF family membrane protein